MIDKKIIISYIESGLSVIPVWGENAPTKKSEKSPSIGEWLPLQTGIMGISEIDRMFSRAASIGIIGGKVSAGLEIIDFDNHDGEAKNRFSQFMDMTKDLIKERQIPYEKTPSGGYHFFYRCKSPDGNKKLASKILHGKKDTIIETRGEKGYVVCCPSNGYSLLYGSILKIPIITEEERDRILSMCKSFDEITENAVEGFGKYVKMTDHRPGDEYNVSVRGLEEAKTLLKREGWTNTYSNYWTRPGKKGRDGISATFGHNKKNDGTPLFHIFSSNASPFEDNKNYTPFAIFTMLGHGGNYSDAAKELLQEGYGERRDIPKGMNAELPKEVREKLVATEVDTEVPDKKKKEKKAPVTEAKEYLSMTWDFRLNIINNIVEAKRKSEFEWKNVNENDIWSEVSEYGIKMSKDNIKSILGSSFVPEYNAFREYFKKIHTWDGVDYFFEITKYMDIDDPAFFRDMLEKHFVRAIKCALEDDYYNRMVFVLQSKNQEIGKSRFIHYINPFGSKYFSEQPLSDQKDCQISLSETFIYNLEELDSLGPSRLSSIKANLAKYSILERRPYGAQNISMPRRCTFFASTNYGEFLVDDVNTRWLIFKVDSIDKGIWASINKDDLWSQAWALYNEPSFIYELTPEEKIKREDRNRSFRENTIEENIIAQYFEGSKNEYMYISDIIKYIIIYAGPGVRICQNASILSKQLESMGFGYIEESVFNKKIKKYGIRRKTP